jgi:cell division protein FtsB
MIKNALMGIISIFLLFSLIKNFSEYQKNIKFYHSFKSDFEAAQQKNNKLRTEIVKENDPSELEKTIRNKLNLLKPNEIAIIVPTPTPTPFVATPTPPPVYKQWVEVFVK